MHPCGFQKLCNFCFLDMKQKTLKYHTEMQMIWDNWGKTEKWLRMFGFFDSVQLNFFFFSPNKMSQKWLCSYFWFYRALQRFQLIALALCHWSALALQVVGHLKDLCPMFICCAESILPCWNAKLELKSHLIYSILYIIC